MTKRCCERTRSFIGERDWLIPSVLGVMVLLVFSLLLLYKTSLAVSAQILFSGSLVVTSLLLVSIQRAFNKHVREKDDPDLIIVGDPERNIRQESRSGKDKHIVEFMFRVCHPAPIFAALWKVHIKNTELSNESWEIQNWKIEKIDIDRRVLIRSQSYLPVLVKPNEITNVIFEAIVDVDTRDEAKNITKLKWGFEYQIGNYQRKTKGYERNVTTKKQ